MRKEIITCDRCGTEVRNGVTNFYLTSEGNGSARSQHIDGRDLCRVCMGIIFEAIANAVKKP